MKTAIELVGSVEVAEDVEKCIKTAGVRGLDFDKARELGLFNRISNLLCAAHSCVMVAYRIYGGADHLLSELGARRNEIAREMGQFERSFDRFISFWTDYYDKTTSQKDVNDEMETLYHNVMEWSCLPESWQLGDEQRIDKNDFVIKVVRDGENDLYFRSSVLESELLEDVVETWCVTKYDNVMHKSTIVEKDMDKASAMMVAKRLSSDDTSAIYTASIVREFVEKRTEVTPYKCYKNNETIGKLKNLVK